MENKLITVGQKEFYALDSREVAEMMGKKHGALMKDINGSNDGKSIGILQVLEKSKFDFSGYFVPDTYKTDGNNKSYNMYWITKKGCELLGNKLQGEKGILYSVKYVERFNEMEQHIAKNQDSYMIQDPIERAKRWIKEQEEKKLIEVENKKLTKEITYKEDVIVGLVDDIDLTTKRQRLNQIIKKCENNKISHRWGLLYSEFEKKYHIDIKRRMKREDVKTMKPKIKSKIDYIDRVMQKIPELYDLACKIFENDVEKLKKEWFENVKKDKKY